MKQYKLGFIGAGNMGGAIIKGLISTGVLSSEDIMVNDANKESLANFCKETNTKMAESNSDLVLKTEAVVIAVKPVVLDNVLKEIAPVINENLVISIVAGAKIETFRNKLGNKARIVRTMPNTPAMVLEGMTILCYDELCTEEDKDFAEKIFKSVGRIEIFEEKYMNEVIALTSSSPAYVFMMIEAMGDAAVLSGIPRNKAYSLAAQAIMGSAKMVLETGKHPAELKDMVCSPAGTTIEAVAELEDSGFRNSLIKAMNKCTEKANRMSGKK